jgi:phosphatidylserine/phosphatidylglycerophosphate/cardiolipin synthase-like enzyme
VALIDSATKGDVISIYNEELKSDTNSPGELWNALIAALAKGVSVQIFMSAPPSQSENPPYGPYGQDKDFVTLAAAGASVHLLAAEAYLQETSTGFPSGNPTYIHAKAFLLNDSAGNFIDGYVGSTNGSSNSIYFNRELGLALKNYPALAKSIQATFTKDFSIANPAAPAAPFNFTVPKAAPATGGLYPVAWYAKGSSPQSAALTDGGYSTFARQACGAAFTPPATTTSAAAATTTTSSSTTSTSSTTTTTKGS